MRMMALKTCMVLFICAISINGLSQEAELNDKQTYSDPSRFENAIQEFENIDKKQPPPEGAIVCIGSSSMRGWHPTIRKDLAPLTIIPRGFGGSNMNDALYYVDRVIMPYKPRAVVIYEGDNDVAQGILPHLIADTFRQLVSKIHKQLPTARIYFLSVKPSIRRWEMWPEMQEVNRLIESECSKDSRLTFVDVASGMLGEDGKPRSDIFKEDNLHMVRNGYFIWRDALRPILLKNELPFEPK